MEVRCTIIHGEGGIRREVCVLAAIPRVGETIVLGIGGPEFHVDQVTHVANRRNDIDPHAIIHATKFDQAARS
jgi:hypothetical protein